MRVFTSGTTAAINESSGADGGSDTRPARTRKGPSRRPSSSSGSERMYSPFIQVSFSRSKRAGDAPTSSMRNPVLTLQYLFSWRPSVARAPMRSSVYSLKMRW